jgi:hypothetical protein
MKKNSIGFTVLAFIILMGGSFKGTAQSVSKTNFSGTWVINLQKSQFGDAPHYTAGKQVMVSQTPRNINLEFINTSESGSDSTVNESLPLNGNALELIDAGKRTRKIVPQFSQDGKTLTILTTASMPDDPKTEQFTSTDLWNLADDGQTLTIRKTVKAASGFEYTITAVYQKK